MAGRLRCLWFRVDLRIDDNPALQAACRGSGNLLPVFVFDPKNFNVPTLAGARKSSARRAQFLLESVECLRKSLEKRGSGLAVGLGSAEDVFSKLCGDAQDIFLQESVCSEERSEEARVEKRLKGSKLQRVWGGTLYLPEECGQQPNNTPTLFTSFKNKAEGRGTIRQPIEPPKKLPELPQLPEDVANSLSYLPSLEDLGYSRDEAEAAKRSDPRGVLDFRGGEEAALARMQKWIWEDDRLQEYKEIRNGMLGEGFSSKLSPWLALGCMSPRRIYKEVQHYESERVKNKSTYWLIFELEWRDFFVYMAKTQGDKIFYKGGVVGDKAPWKNPKGALQRWKDGKTGDPLVDANMRELAATGFMSNRGRQNVASYLIFNLEVDWRHGAAHFEEHLLDYDPCSNWGNWVAAAGLTGQRINKFNTKKQLNDYDPERRYVRHWLEESKSSPTEMEVDEEGASSAGRRWAPKSQHDEKGKGKGKGKDKQGKSGGKSGKGKGKGHHETSDHKADDADAHSSKRGRWKRVENRGYEDAVFGA